MRSTNFARETTGHLSISTITWRLMQLHLSIPFCNCSQTNDTYMGINYWETFLTFDLCQALLRLVCLPSPCWAVLVSARCRVFLLELRTRWDGTAHLKQFVKVNFNYAEPCRTDWSSLQKISTARLD